MSLHCSHVSTSSSSSPSASKSKMGYNSSSSCEPWAEINWGDSSESKIKFKWNFKRKGEWRYETVWFFPCVSVTTYIVEISSTCKRVRNTLPYTGTLQQSWCFIGCCRGCCTGRRNIRNWVWSGSTLVRWCSNWRLSCEWTRSSLFRTCSSRRNILSSVRLLGVVLPMRLKHKVATLYIDFRMKDVQNLCYVRTLIRL